MKIFWVMKLVVQLAKSTQNTPFEKWLSSKLFMCKLPVKIQNRILVHFKEWPLILE